MYSMAVMCVCTVERIRNKCKNLFSVNVTVVSLNVKLNMDQSVFAVCFLQTVIFVSVFFNPGTVVEPLLTHCFLKLRVYFMCI